MTLPLPGDNHALGHPMSDGGIHHPLIEDEQENVGLDYCFKIYEFHFSFNV